jgi:hypothetical protein
VIGGMVLAGFNQSIRKEAISATSFTTNPIRTGIRLNLCIGFEMTDNMRGFACNV